MFYRYLFYYIMNTNLQIKKQLKEISNEEANSSCFDCGNKPANWASISNGIFLCLDCSSEHRGYGIEISFIRSITMDQWTQEQVNIMKIGGNQRLKDFLTNYEIPENMDRKIIYFSNLMNFYRKQIKAESMGRINMEPLPSKEVFWNKMNSYDRNNFNNNIKDNENKNKNEIIIEVDQYQQARNKLNILSEQSEEINNIKENVSDNKDRYISIGSEQNNTNNNNNSYLSSYTNWLPNIDYFNNVRNIINNVNGTGMNQNSEMNDSTIRNELRYNIFSLGSKTLTGFSYMGSKIIENGIKAIKSDTFKNFLYKTGEGIWYIKDKIMGSSNNNNSNNDNSEEEIYSFLEQDNSV